MIEKYFTLTSNEVELRINRVRINRSRPVIENTVCLEIYIERSSKSFRANQHNLFQPNRREIKWIFKLYITDGISLDTDVFNNFELFIQWPLIW